MYNWAFILQEATQQSRQSRRLPYWIWFLLAKSLGIKLSPTDRPIFGTLMRVLTLLFALGFAVTFTWHKVYDIVSEYTKETVLTGLWNFKDFVWLQSSNWSITAETLVHLGGPSQVINNLIFGNPSGVERWGPYLQTGQWGHGNMGHGNIKVTPNVITFCILLV